MEIYYKYGTHIVEKNIHILCDPTLTISSEDEKEKLNESKVKKVYNDITHVLLSHGHNDHIDLLPYLKEETPIYTHPFTHQFKIKLFDKKNEIIYIKEKEKIIISKNFILSAYPSGHCGGSLMFFIELYGKKILFTGDINSENTLSTMMPKPINCDVLLIESTFGKPEYILKPREEIYEVLLSHINQKMKINNHVIIYGHGLGKLQDIIRLLNDQKYETIYTDMYSSRICNIYDQYYKKLGKYDKITDSIVLKDKSILCISMHLGYEKKNILNLIHEYGLNPNTPIIYTTGWGNKEKIMEKEDDLEEIEKTEVEKNFEEITKEFKDVEFFPLSSHSGYENLLYFIDSCDPEYVGLFHGFPEAFSKTLKDIGTNGYNLTKEKIKL